MVRHSDIPDSISLSEFKEFLIGLPPAASSKGRYKAGEIRIRISPDIVQVLDLIPTFLTIPSAESETPAAAGNFSINDLATYLFRQFISQHLNQFKEMRDEIRLSRDRR